MCKYPYVRSPTGITRLKTVLSEEARLAVTPFGCGKCLPCRINKARIWTHRLLLEQQLHGDSCFVTLTYDDEHLPADGSLQPVDLTKFLKRLRRAIGKNKIRHYCVGEYGSRTYRPHYHCALYGIGIDHASTVTNCWGHGFTYTGDLNKDSARYITGYLVQKLTKKADSPVQNLHPEFARMSTRNGGIGRGAIDLISERFNRKVYNEPGIFRELSHGKKKMPLGRYLTDRIHQQIGTKQSDIDLSLYDYQQDIIDNYLHSEDYYKRMCDEKEQERRNQLARFNIKNQKRSL